MKEISQFREVMCMPLRYQQNPDAYIGEPVAGSSGATHIIPVRGKRRHTQMKILIINPPGPGDERYLREGRCMHKAEVWTTILPPISLVLIGTILKNDGHDVEVLDSAALGLTFKELEKTINQKRYEMCIINTATPTIQSDLKVAQLIKGANPDCTTASFGIHVSALPEETLKQFPHLDIIIRGEPEETAREIVTALRDSIPKERIMGISFRQDGRIIHNPERGFIKDLDNLPVPDWSLVPYKKYILPLKYRPYLYVLTSRGCPYPCSFCAQKRYYGENPRLRSAEKITEEIKFLRKRYKIKDFMLWADTFTINREHAIRICENLIREGIKIGWTTTTRVDLVDKELLQLMKKSGCWLIVHGLESGDQKILDIAKKGTEMEKIRETIILEKELGFKIIGHFVLGFPEDTRESINKTIELALSLPIDFAQFYFAVPFPGSPLYDSCKQNGSIEAEDWTRFEQDRTVIKNPNLKEEELIAMRNRAYKEFYLRPRIIKENIRMLLHPRGIIEILKNGRNFLDMLLS